MADVAEQDAELPPGAEIPTERIFQAALDDFKSSLTEAQRSQFPGKKLLNVQLKIMGIQKHQERLKALMNFSRIQYYLERFVEFDNVCRSTKIGGADSDELSSFIWGPSNYILQVSQEDPNVLNVILDAYQRFGRRIPKLQEYNDLIAERPNMIKCIAFMYHDLLQFYKRIIKLLTGRGWKKTFFVDWRYYEKSFDTLLESFDDHGKILKRLLDVWRNQQSQQALSQGATVATNTHRRLNDYIMHQNRRDGTLMDMDRQLNNHVVASNEVYKQIRDLIRQYERDRAEIHCNAMKAEEDRKSQQMEEVLKWLTSGIQQSTYHQTFRSVSTEVPETEDGPGTAVWILKENKIINWMHEESPTNAVMWLNGKKGAGKTILVSTIIQECMDTRPDFKTSYFYCRGEDNSRLNTAVAILKEILRQLLVHNQDPLPSCAAKKVNSGEEVLTNIDTIKSLLELFCDRDMNQFIVIDGLDECNFPEVKPVVKFWLSMVEKCEGYRPGKIRVLFVSQDSGDIRKLMQDAEIFAIPPEQSANDIRKYVRHKFDELQEKFRLSDEETFDAREQVSKRAEGMFLYAVLTIENLFKQPNVRALKEELLATNIPSGIGEAYKKIIERLERDSVRSQWLMAKTIFALLAGARRPLKRHELQAALSVEIREDGETYLDYHHNRLCNDIRETCGTLVEVVQKDRFEFIHSTTKQFILESPHLDYKTIQCDLTILSLRYLTLECFRPDLNDDDITHCIRNGSYAFQDYAIAEWSQHLDKFIRNTAPLFEESPDYEAKVSNAMTRFLEFHESSIVAAAEEKPSTGSKKSQQRQQSLNAMAAQASLQTLSPPSTQQSSSSRSPSPLSQQTQQQQGIDPAIYCQAFAERTFYPQLVELWTHICKHEKRDFKERPKVSLPHLEKLLDGVRTKIAELAASGNREKNPTNKENLQEFYGERHYKCQRVRCDFFYEGFDNKTAADNHANKHDRPYPCPIQGCAMVPFGFQTNKDKDRHIRNYHPDESDQPARFVHGQPEGRQTAEARWECDLCGKKFTRQSIRKDHIDAHYGERKHACEMCGKRFTRSNDRNRHRKTHVRKLRG